jgi:DNA-binding GntR family transcriptional regulator
VRTGDPTLGRPGAQPYEPRLVRCIEIRHRYPPHVSQQPRYREVADDLRRRVVADEFPRGLPSERALRGHYGISEATLRPALVILEAEGLLTRRRGANHQVRREPERIIVTVDLPGAFEITARAATADERQRLGLAAGAWVMVVWDLGRLDPDGNPTLWDVVPAATSRLRGGEAERPDPV